MVNRSKTNTINPKFLVEISISGKLILNGFKAKLKYI